MWILASYADKDEENVYQTPGFNKTKNTNFVDSTRFLDDCYTRFAES